MKEITATILTFNEERRIENCLRSLEGVADEIVVVDSFSTDRTLEICKRYGCRVKQRKLSGYGAQRQFATSLASNNYILAIDADEALSPELAQSIRNLKAEGLSHRVYCANRLNFYCGRPVRHCGWYPDCQVRLFDRRYANWNLRDVAERVIFRDCVSPQLLAGDILHYRCDTQAEFLAKERAHSALRAQLLASSVGSIGLLRSTVSSLKAFAMCYLFEKGFAEGLRGLTISLERFHCEQLTYATARRLQRDDSKMNIVQTVENKDINE